MADKTQVGHRSRLRQKFMQAGIGAFHDYELIEMLLTLTTPLRDMKQPAKEALRRFGSLAGVLEAPLQLLMEIDGIGETNAFALKLPHAVSRRYLQEQIIGADFIRSSSSVHTFLTHNLRDRNREVFMVIFLNGQNRILKMEELFEGTLTSSAVYPREVIKRALDYDSAALIFVHNHPSGNTSPSAEDQAITKKLIAAAETIGVKVLDHLIIGGNDYYSFADKGLIK